MSTLEEKITIKLAKEALATLDWKKFAEAFRDMEADWHAKEWKEFIEVVRQDERKRVVEEIEKKSWIMFLKKPYIPEQVERDRRIREQMRKEIIDWLSQRKEENSREEMGE